MSSTTRDLFVGSSRDEGLSKTINVFLSKLHRLADWRGDRLLDVGCGHGTFTRLLGKHYNEVHGIDVQDHYLERFRAATARDPKFHVHNMSAASMDFPDNYFDTIVTLETLEHVADLPATASEILRVAAPGANIVISVPNRLFPCENHGADIGTFSVDRAPFLTYLPPLHRKWARARAFLVRDLDALFVSRGAIRTNTDYLWPTFEHGGNRMQAFLKPFFRLMRVCENAPVFIRMFGTSILVQYRKQNPS